MLCEGLRKFRIRSSVKVTVWGEQVFERFACLENKYQHHAVRVELPSSYRWYPLKVMLAVVELAKRGFYVKNYIVHGSSS